MAAKAKKKTNFWEDPVFQAFYNAQVAPGLGGRNLEQNRLNTLQGTVYGAGGDLAQNQLAATADKNRLAEEMAYRGGTNSGMYLGTQKGLGVMQDVQQSANKANIENKYTSQTNPINLLAQGLKRNPDGSISPLAEGENMIDPLTGKKKKFSFMNDTQAGLQARSAALAQYAAANAKTKV